MIDFNFYTLPQPGNDISAIDFCTEPIVDLTGGCRGEDALFRSTVNKHIEYKLYNPALPLNPSNPIKYLLSENERQKYHINKINVKRKERWKTRCKDQWNWLRKNRPKVLYESFKNIDATHSKSDIPLYPIFFPKFWKSGIFVGSIFSGAQCLTDIPEKVIVEMLDESLMMDYTADQQGYDIKNCLKTWRSPEDQIYILYPQGAILSDLAVGLLSLSGLSQLDLKNLLVVKNNFCIKELSIQNHYLFVRGDYEVVKYDLSSLGNGGLKELHRYQFDEELYCTSSNPFNEELVAVTKSHISCVKGSHRKCFGLSDDAAWRSCIYGNFQQTCLLSSVDSIQLHDFREAEYSTKSFFELPCEYIGRSEKLAPVLEWSPTNVHQYVTATNETVLIMDERYLKTPCLRLNHYMKTPPHFLQCMARPYATAGRDSLFICTANYKHKESFCIQLCKSGIQNVKMGANGTAKANRPVTLIDKPWKFSSVEDWVADMDHWKLFHNSITDRLAVPLIGMSVVEFSQNTGHADQLAFIQQTQAGDLFFQRFDCTNSFNTDDDGKCKRRKTLVENINVFNIGDCHSRCKDWIDHTVDIYSGLPEEDVKEKSQSKDNESKILKEEKTDEKINCPEEKCAIRDVLLNNLEIKCENKVISTTLLEKEYEEYLLNLEKDEANNNVLSNKSYAICSAEEEIIYRKVLDVRNRTSIVTNKTLGIERKYRHLCLFDLDVKSKYPLSQCLQANWINDEYTPLDEFAPNVALDPSLNREAGD